MNYFDLLKYRKSVRKFTDQQITEKELSDILLAANSAPVGSAFFKDIHLIVVQNNDILNKLSQAQNKRFEDKKRMKEILGENSPVLDVEKTIKAPDPFYGAPTVIFVSHRNQKIQPGIEYSNVACITFAMHLAATYLGLGSVFLWGVLEAMRELPELDNSFLLNVPDGFSPILGLVGAGLLDSS